MKNFRLLLIILALVSCRKDQIDRERILSAGKWLTTIDPEMMGTHDSDIVYIGDGLKEVLVELQVISTNYKYDLIEGDLEEPFGSHEADAVLIIVADSEKLELRMKLDESLDKYHIIGWRSTSTIYLK